MRTLVLCHEGAPMLVSLTATPIRRRILEMPDDDAELFAVWSVPPPDSMAPAEDITAQFASTWAMEFATREAMPAFILELLPERLPNPIRRRA